MLVVVFLMMAILTGVKWNLSVVLICISFMATDGDSWGYIQRNTTQITPEAPAHPCLLQHYSQ
jgi:hypothetical protein